MWDTPAGAPPPGSGMRRALRWKPATYAQVWLFDPVPGLAGSIAWYLTSHFWFGHNAWYPAIEFGLYVTALDGLIGTRRLRRRARVGRGPERAGSLYR